ncbi:MAG: VOC family protein [Treponema sp.]|jgi:lactoylglutathione lyase|nr:VOC family protein [Treponema sp.]
MFFRLEHSCIHVTDLKKALEFYEKALDLKEIRRKGSAKMEVVFIGNDESSRQLALIQKSGQTGAYDMGDNSTHFAMRTDDLETARQKHAAMECIDHELPEFGVYFIRDPDGYLIEIMPVRK